MRNLLLIFLITCVVGCGSKENPQPLDLVIAEKNAYIDKLVDQNRTLSYSLYRYEQKYDKSRCDSLENALQSKNERDFEIYLRIAKEINSGGK